MQGSGAEQHNSLTLPWWILEILPKAAKLRETRRRSLAGLYVPAGERRMIAQDDQVHPSVSSRLTARADYRPPNLPAGKAAKQDRRQ